MKWKVGLQISKTKRPGQSHAPAFLFSKKNGLELVGDLGFEGKIVNFLMRQGGKMGA